jgi:uncharacterized protein
MGLNKDKILKILDENKEKINSYGVKKLKLFGSFATGMEDENSDIDFLVEVKEDTDRKYNRIRKLSILLGDLFNKKIDIGLEEDLDEIFKDAILSSKMVEVTV